MHRYRLKTRKGETEWTPASLASWIEVLTGQQVQVSLLPEGLWFVRRKRKCLEITLEGTQEQADRFFQVVRHQIKIEAVSS